MIMNKQTELCNIAVAWFLKATESALCDNSIDDTEKVREIRAKVDSVNKFMSEKIDFNNLNEAQAVALGMEVWDKRDDGKLLYLFPHWAYELIKKLDGLELSDVNGGTIVVSQETKDKLDDDQRFGLLAYGLYLEAE